MSRVSYQSHFKSHSNFKREFNNMNAICANLVLSKTFCKGRDGAFVLDDEKVMSSKALRQGTRGALGQDDIFIPNNGSPEFVAKLKKDAVGIATVWKGEAMAALLTLPATRTLRAVVLDLCSVGRTAVEQGILPAAIARMSPTDPGFLVLTWSVRNKDGFSRTLMLGTFERIVINAAKILHNLVAKLVYVFNYNDPSPMCSIYFVLVPPGEAFAQLADKTRAALVAFAVAFAKSKSRSQSDATNARADWDAGAGASAGKARGTAKGTDKDKDKDTQKSKIKQPFKSKHTCDKAHKWNKKTGKLRRHAAVSLASVSASASTAFASKANLASRIREKMQRELKRIAWGFRKKPLVRSARFRASKLST